MVETSLKRLVAAFCFILLSASAGPRFFVEVAQAQTAREYTVDGLALGGVVRKSSQAYQQYQCSPSSQFPEFTYCVRNKQDQTPHGQVATTTSIMHDGDGNVAYVNQYIAPAFFAPDDVTNEISRLSAKYAQPAKVFEAARRAGVAAAQIAVWGEITLSPISASDMAIARTGGSPGKGILIDFLGDFPRSAQLDLPIYSVSGRGFVWAAHYNEQGRGGLRFFAIDNARLRENQGQKEIVAQTPPWQPPPAPSPWPPPPSPPPTPEKRVVHLTLVSDETASLLDKCGSSCPDDAAADKLRTDIEANVDRQTLAAQEAQDFTAAVGDPKKLADYIANCKLCEFKNDARQLTSISPGQDPQQADSEKRQYDAAQDNVEQLRKYVADCHVCAFAKQAIAVIDQAASKYADEVFDAEVCNNEYLAVYVAYAGKPDPNSDLWTKQGWYEIEPGQCRTVATLTKGDFYLNAHDKRGVWASGEMSYCTSNTAFDQVMLISGDECGDDESLTKFGLHHFEGAGSKYTWTLDPIPWSFSAIAYSPANSAWGWSTGSASQEEAERTAIDWCSRNASDCRVAAWARDDSCLALAEGTNNDGGTSLGWSYGENGSPHNAWNECYQHGGTNCRIVHQKCR